MSLNAYKIRSAQFNLGLEDLMKARTDPNMRLTATPFVDNAENTVFVGKAAPWKGKHGSAFENSAPDEVIRGLSKAISISKACAGIKGTVTVGGHRLPKKDVCEMEQGTSKKRYSE